MGLVTRKPVFGVSDKVRFKPASWTTETSKKIENALEASLDMMVSNTRITKALIRLCGCTVWSAPVLFANPEDRFSHVEAQMICLNYMWMSSDIHFTISRALTRSSKGHSSNFELSIVWVKRCFFVRHNLFIKRLYCLFHFQKTYCGYTKYILVCETTLCRRQLWRLCKLTKTRTNRRPWSVSKPLGTLILSLKSWFAKKCKMTKIT